ncbi:MAG TPA: discoidin domain-containing protein [Actinokineospora sp.]|jgi:hypothetical protein|nr:discoidin domain-containing protein [Actinokineospora sp.]
MSSILRRLIVVATSAVLTGGIIATPAQAAVQATFYVSPTGSGTACTLSAPCSLQGGVDKVRTVNSNMTGDIIVNLLDGTYALTSELQFREDATFHDSGTNGYSVTYRANPGARPVISGGKTLAGWSADPANSSIYRTFVGANPGVLQMYVNGTRATVARSEPKPAGFTLASDTTSGAVRYLVIDAFKVHDGATETTVNDNAPGITYSGAWTYDSNRPGDYSNDSHYTRTHSNYAEYTFTGTGIDLIAGKAPSFAKHMQIYIDGVKDQMVSQYNATALTQQVIYSKTGLAPGQHTIKVLAYSEGDLIVTNPAYASMSSWKNIDSIRFGLLQTFKYLACPLEKIVGDTAYFQDPCGKGVLDSFQQTYGPDMAALDHHGLTEYWLENAYELLDSPGEYYYDPTDQYLYYKPRPYEDLATATVVVPQVETLMSVTGSAATPIRDLSFQGLTFAYGTWLAPRSGNGFVGFQGNQLWGAAANAATAHNEFWNSMDRIGGAVTISAGRSVSISGSHFTHLGGTGVVVENASQDTLVEGNAFNDISGGGIQVGNVNDFAVSDPAQQSVGNTVKNNYISAIGLQYPQVAAIFAGYNKNLALVHNEIDNVPYTGISVGWGWGMESSTPYSAANVVSGNRITNVMQTLTDGGGIYTLSHQPGSTINNNFVSGVGTDGFGGAIYLDNRTNNYSVTQNVVRNPVPRWLNINASSPAAINNSAADNYTDNGATKGIGGTNTETNTTVVTGGNWPAAATAIEAAAGLEPQYDHLKNAAGVWVDDTANTVSYTGSWIADGNRRAAGGFDYRRTDHNTSSAGAEATLRFVGTAFDVIAETNGTYASGVQVYIDGQLSSSTITETSTGLLSKRTVFRRTGLAFGAHEVRLVTTTTQPFHVDAFVIYDSECSLSTGKTATASSQYSSSYSAAKAVDGSLSTRWAQQGGQWTSAWLKVDLGDSYSVNSVRSNFHYPSGSGVKYQIEYSTDDVTYTMLADRTASYTTQADNWATPAGLTLARYVRITVVDSQGQGASIYEFDVYGAPTPGLEVVSLGKPATASSIYSASYSAAKAVDGNASTRWAQASGTSGPAWVLVDLGIGVPLSRVDTVFYQNAGNGFKYKIEYSMDDTTYLTYSDHTASFTTSPNNVDTNAGTIVARYVRITVTDSQSQGASIFSFDVFGIRAS